MQSFPADVTLAELTLATPLIPVINNIDVLPLGDFQRRWWRWRSAAKAIAEISFFMVPLV